MKTRSADEYGNDNDRISTGAIPNWRKTQIQDWHRITMSYSREHRKRSRKAELRGKKSFSMPAKIEEPYKKMWSAIFDDVRAGRLPISPVSRREQDYLNGLDDGANAVISEIEIHNDRIVRAKKGQNVFFCGPYFCTVSFNGKALTIPTARARGLHYLAKLLASPKRSFSPVELLEPYRQHISQTHKQVAREIAGQRLNEGEQAPRSKTTQATVDREKERTRLTQNAKTIAEELRRAERQNDQAAETEAREGLAAIQDRLKELQRPRTATRDVDKNFEKERKAVDEAIRAAYTTLKHSGGEAGDMLATHLRQYITHPEKSRWQYTPQTPTPWITT